MGSTSQIIKHLADCYQADNRQLRISNYISSPKVGFIKIIDGQEELINNVAPKLAIPYAYAEQVLKVLALYKSEKELFYGSFFLLGKDESRQPARKIAAPLLLFPAELLFEKDNYFLYVDGENPRVNSSFFEALNGKYGGDVSMADFIENIPKFPFDFGVSGRIMRFFKQHFSEMEVDDMLYFPNLWKENKLKRYLQPKQLDAQRDFRLVPSSALGIVKKSTDTYGIISELKKLSDSKIFSPALKCLLGKTEKLLPPLNKSSIMLPGQLSAAQCKAVENARRETHSIIIGPPGTGKSYTSSCIAIDHLMRGQSVLIVSQQNEAVDVCLAMIEKMLGTDKLCIRGGDKSNAAQMKKRLNEILNQRNFSATESNYRSLKNTIAARQKRIKRLAKKLDARMGREISWGKQLTGKSLENTVRTAIIEAIHGFFDPLWETLESYNVESANQIEAIKTYIKEKFEQELTEVLNRDRQELAALNAAVRARNSSRRASLMESINIKILLRAFPIWLCRQAELYKILPLYNGTFDVVIIDEASQCDMATCLPAIQRAKRVVIVGDPNQLRHVTFLSRMRLSQIGNGHKLTDEEIATFDFRKNSLLDLAIARLSSQRNSVFLNEHFRSTADIIQFSNEQFYSSDLRIMRQRPEASQGLETVYLKYGSRDPKKGINLVEVEAILLELHQLVRSEEDLDDDLKSSIGVLSPFRDQVDALFAEISSQFTLAEIAAHQIMVGTAYNFQGNERDIMLLSFAVDADSHHSAFLHINKTDVFNVSITRARHVQKVYHSFLPQQLDSDSYLRKFLESALETQKVDTSSNPSKDQFLKEVLAFVSASETSVWSDYIIAGFQIDILLKSNAQYFGIDLIGYPGDFEEHLSSQQITDLGRAKISIFPLAFSAWQLKRAESKAALTRFLIG